jgi:hypothetical protein
MQKTLRPNYQSSNNGEEDQSGLLQIGASIFEDQWVCYELEYWQNLIPGWYGF